MNMETFLNAMREMVRQELPKPPTRMGTIPGTYTSGRPTIQFDGESVVSTKTYPYFSSYVPVAGHRVGLVMFGDTWVIVGRII